MGPDPKQVAELVAMMREYNINPARFEVCMPYIQLDKWAHEKMEAARQMQQRDEARRWKTFSDCLRLLVEEYIDPKADVAAIEAAYDGTNLPSA